MADLFFVEIFLSVSWLFYTTCQRNFLLWLFNLSARVCTVEPYQGRCFCVVSMNRWTCFRTSSAPRSRSALLGSGPWLGMFRWWRLTVELTCKMTCVLFVLCFVLNSWCSVVLLFFLFVFFLLTSRWHCFLFFFLLLFLLKALLHRFTVAVSQSRVELPVS